MQKENTVRDHLVKFAPIVDQLIVVIDAANKAFVQQHSQLLVQLIDRQGAIYSEIGTEMKNMNELLAVKSGDEKNHCFRLHSILTHLNIIAETAGRLEETLLKQVKDGILFSDKGISQVNHLFSQQAEILRYLATVMRNDGESIRGRAIEQCRSLDQSCIQFATDHETRLVEGLCYPQAAPIFLAILDQMQTIAHHELEIASLLGSEI